MCALMWLRVYNHNLGFQLFKVCFEYSRYASHFLFHARLVTCKSAKKWYLMRMYISWLCPFKLVAWGNSWQFAMPPLSYSPTKGRPWNTHRNFILMTCHYPDLSTASDWLYCIGNLFQPIRGIACDCKCNSSHCFSPPLGGQRRRLEICLRS